MGFLYADVLYKNKDIYFKIWLGGVFGLVIFMAGTMVTSLVFDFTYLSHIVLIVLTAVPYALLFCKNRKSARVTVTDERRTESSGMTNRIFLFLVLPLTLLICALMTTHVLAPTDGGVASGQSTFGDLQMHLGFITSIAEQRSFPPEYNLLSGTRLSYPFLADMLSSSLYLFKTPLRWAVLMPSYVFALLTVMGFYILSYSLTKSKAAAVTASVMFFFNGAFGFAYFLDGAKADHSIFTRIFTEYYQTPTNLNDMNIRWSNTICDMIIPQRTTMAGWCVLFSALWLLADAVRTNESRAFVTLGVIAGCMPMIHTHSFLALGIISAVMFAICLVQTRNKKRCLVNWFIYGAIALAAAAPQLFFWTFSQTGGNEGFLNFNFNWVNKNDPYLWFYIKNWGLVFIFVIPAFFVLAEIIQFQPNEYDNNKLFYVTYMIAVILTAQFFVRVYGKLRGVKGRTFIGAAVIFVSVFSGVLTIAREWISGAQYRTFTDEDIEYAEFIKENTDAQAVFLTGTQHINTVAALAGRTIYVGSSLYVYFHGFADAYDERSTEVSDAYEGSFEDMRDFAKRNNISYISVSPYEEGDYNVNQDALDRFEKVYSDGRNTLYKVE